MAQPLRTNVRFSPSRGITQLVPERCKIHDLIMQGVELTLKKRGYPPIAEMKAKWRGQNR
jgi:hypothetical protein